MKIATAKSYPDTERFTNVLLQADIEATASKTPVTTMLTAFARGQKKQCLYTLTTIDWFFVALDAKAFL